MRRDDHARRSIERASGGPKPSVEDAVAFLRSVRGGPSRSVARVLEELDRLRKLEANLHDVDSTGERAWAVRNVDVKRVDHGDGTFTQVRDFSATLETSRGRVHCMARFAAASIDSVPTLLVRQCAFIVDEEGAEPVNAEVCDG